MLDMILGKQGVKGAQPGPPLSWLQRVKIVVSAAKGLEFLHEKVDPPIIHTNIKSSNILLFDNDVAKIGDIGVSIYRTPNRDDYLFETIWDPRYSSGWGSQPPGCGVQAPEYVMEDFHTFRITLMPRLLNDMPGFLLLRCCFLL
jgi:pto-interacting protein 1